MSEEIKDIILDVKDSLNETPKNMYKYNKITLNLNEFEEILDYIEQLENIRKEAIEWCKCVINSKTTAGELPNGKRTDMGYCLDLTEPLLKILEWGKDER